ncbi:hypothetical protein CVS29_12000 [Arthrobacter psychrochitiniphilus]|uniref:Uncharacterized protein n=1 Tax=Arthrobacter psychrochitiniphilus TaxID=291045 RepID=A0A2V3DPM4_9MICC|nr:hypothetical protein CVS29_12000 [Arthrobacter psychrochitiniphilus]
MISILQWVVLGVCLLCTAWRLPAVRSGHNRGLFWIFALASIAVALSIPSIYFPVDKLLGGHNLANVIVRLSLFSVFFLLASRVAAAYKSPRALKLIRGPVGLLVLAASTVGILITFLLSEVEGSSPGLTRFGDQPTVAAYMWIGLSYTAYAAAILVPATAKTALSAGYALVDRSAAACLSMGFFLVCITLVLKLAPLPVGSLVQLLSFGSILFVAAGMSLVWFSFIRRPAQQ